VHFGGDAIDGRRIQPLAGSERLGLQRVHNRLFGIVGALWCVAWRRWFRDLPEEQPAVNEAELKLIRADRDDQEPEQSHRIPWKTVLTSANLAFICLMYFAYGYAS
jgi:hypothetical protein